VRLVKTGPHNTQRGLLANGRDVARRALHLVVVVGTKIGNIDTATMLALFLFIDTATAAKARDPSQVALVELNADGLTIGREASDFIINDPRVSRRHLRLVLHGETVFACNESTNGTKLNGIRMARGEAVALGCSCAFFVGHLI